jgi:hypothetical protein
MELDKVPLWRGGQGISLMDYDAPGLLVKPEIAIGQMDAERAKANGEKATSKTGEAAAVGSNADEDDKPETKNDNKRTATVSGKSCWDCNYQQIGGETFLGKCTWFSKHLYYEITG